MQIISTCQASENTEIAGDCSDSRGVKILLFPTSRTARTVKETPPKYVDSSTLSCLAAMQTSEKSSHSPWAMLTPEETSTHQIWDTSEPFLQFELFQDFRMSCLRCEDCIQHNDSWGLNPTHPPCGPEKAMCFLHWQQLVSTTDTSVTNPSTK